MATRVPPYFDFLIERFRRGASGRSVHLGHWNDPGRFGAKTPGEPGEFAQAQERLDRVLLNMAELGDGQRILDVGCGFGGTLEEVDGRHRGLDLWGINIDPRQLAICRDLIPRPENRLGWVLADAGALPFRSGSFDRILCIEAMFHFPSRRRFFEEAARVLLPGGILVASDMVIAPSLRDVGVPGAILEAPLQDGYGPWPDFWGEDADHARIAKDCGFSGKIMDATACTRPSHRFTVPPDLDPGRDPGSPALRAALALRWLHGAGHLKYLYLKMSKAGG